MPFIILRQDITKMTTDAIVNAANTDLKMGDGVCGAIFKAAGAAELQAACDKAAPVKTGNATITPAFALQCKYIIHAAGPVYRHWSIEQNERLLRSAYTRSLELAVENRCESIAFPLISSGIYGYPKDKALCVAKTAILDFLAEHEMTVYLLVFDKTAFSVGKELLGNIESYIDEVYVNQHERRRRGLSNSVSHADYEENELKCVREAAIPAPTLYGTGIDEIMNKLDEPFSKTLLRLIDAKGKTDVEVYKRANIDRKLFSKIRTGKDYMPGKRTVIALAIALELNLAETDALLECAGYALSHGQKFDVIIEYFIVNGCYDIFEINEVLFRYDQQLLGC